MLFLRILLKSICLYFISFLNQLLRFATGSKMDVGIQKNEFGILQYALNRFMTPILGKMIDTFFPIKLLKNNIFSFSRTLKVGTIAQSNHYLLRLLSLNLKINVSEDSKDLILKKFNSVESLANRSRPMGQPSFGPNIHMNGSFFYNSLENVSVTNSTNIVFDRNKIGYSQYMDNTFLHQNSNSVSYLTKDSVTGVNFNALEDLYNYLTRFDDKTKLRKYSENITSRTIRKIRKKNRVPKNFRGGRLSKKPPYSTVTNETVRRNVNTLKQIEYILKNRTFFEDKIRKGFGKTDFPHFSDEVKRIMFSTYTPIGSYGKDAIVYSGDLTSKNPLTVGRRINLVQQRGFVGDMESFRKNVGFFNFDTDEEMDNSSEELDNENVNDVFFINPFVVLGFLFYSIIELFVLFYFMSFFLSNPYDTFRFFLKYPSVYFYENLTGFPSPNYFFFAIAFWISVIIIFFVHILELVDEENFEPPTLSWLYGLLNDIVYNFLIIGCLFFCVFEIFNFADLLVSRIFFMGVPGYPNPFSIIFLFIYDIFFLLGTTNYFSFYLENFIQLEVKFPIFYFSEYMPLVQRYPLVQPYFLSNPYLDRPNFFLWLADNFLNLVSGKSSQVGFANNSTGLRLIFQRELIQDVRKYNFIRKNLQDLYFTGQLHVRGWNGFNYRLDLQTCIDPIMASEQVMRFDWRLKNSHSSGLHSRLFKGLPFGSNSSFNTATKKITMTKGPRISSRYGYLQYLTRLDHIKKRGGDGGGWYHSAPRSVRKRLWLSKLNFGDRKTISSKRRFKSFLFSPGRAKFSLMLNEPRRIRTKAERNFKHSRIFRNFWSYISGNDKPRRYFRRKPFVSVYDFSNISLSNYARTRMFLNNSLTGRNYLKLPKIGKYAWRNLYLNKPELLFSTEYVNHKVPLIISKSQANHEDVSSVRKLGTGFSALRPVRSFSASPNSEGNFFADTSVPQQLHVENKEIASSKLLHEKQGSQRIRRRVPRTLKERRVAISKMPNFPFKHSIRHKFIARVFANFAPRYFVKHTASFTTFSKLDEFSFRMYNTVGLFGQNYSFSSGSGLAYPLGLIFSGFNKFSSSGFSPKLVGFDYYYSQNHNFFFALFNNYLKKGQLRTLPTNSARFNHPLQGGLRYGWDFLYPMISELRLTEKVLPVDFAYKGEAKVSYRHLRLDPYEAIRNSQFQKSACYFLDARIQNWLNFTNVIWNDYYHFFFNRSYKTEGNGVKFVLASYNPINGPASYKLFISPSTLEIPRVGQFFFNYIPWLQYKFKWLLYPTSTYKRFDSFRFIHQHANKKFYFTSLLKFYQMNLFRWQQTAQIFQWNQIQARNFLLHLFFHKYVLLSELANLRNSFVSSGLQSSFQSFGRSKIGFYPERDGSIPYLAPSIERFNLLFFSSRKNSEMMKSVATSEFPRHEHEIYIPAFTSNDFRFFQYVVDLRRWKALQIPYIRDWKFERYIRYLGPLLYREDVASLMGFFAPFEYRNQIFVSRLRTNALRFSVFFPKKVIDEKFANPLKRLNFPLWTPRSQKERVRSSGGSFYAFILNRPFLSYSPNYSIFQSTGKRILAGLYPHFYRFSSELDLNFLYGQGVNANLFDHPGKTFSDVLYGERLFTELNSKKKRLFYDKLFWMSKSYELQNISDQVVNKISNYAPMIESKLLNQVILSQLGKPLDLSIQKVIPRVDISDKFKLQLSDSHTTTQSQRAAARVVNHELTKQAIFVQRIHPDIFVRAGGPKIFSKQWQMGQAWIRFVIASQNVSVAPMSSDSELLRNFVEGRVASSLNDVISPIWPTDTRGYSGLPQQSKFIMSFETRPKHGYFNFGLSGIGRLPRLSRSFFQMLFFRNKLEDFKILKVQFLKLYLMSIPLFHCSDFSTNASFKFFWSLVLGFNNSKMSLLPLRYAFLFNNMFRNCQINMDFSSLVHYSPFGTIVPVYSREQLGVENILVLYEQYDKFKAYKKYQFFINFSVFQVPDQVSLNLSVSDSEQKNAFSVPFNRGVFISMSELSYYYIQKSMFVIRSLLINASFDFFNSIFIHSSIFRETNKNTLIFVNKTDKEFNRFDKLAKFFTSNLSPMVFTNIFSAGFIIREPSFQDFFRERFYYGSFRSKLHWYLYPVHSFFIIRNYLSETVVNYINEYLIFSFQIYFKYSQSILSLLHGPIPDKLNRMYFSSFHNGKGNTLPFSLRSQSDFFQAFNQMKVYASFSNHKIFPIRILFRIKEPIILRALFNFTSVNEEEVIKFSNTFSAFFFSVNFLQFFQKLNSKIFLPSYLYKLGSDTDNAFLGLQFAEDFEFFSTNLFKNTRSIDGSGRHNRPRSVGQTLDSIFSYREYEKYRKEHHRQRFRSISPYWLQNSFRNRAHYSYGYRSPENRRRRQMHAALVTMLKRVARLDRYKLHPSHTRRISFLGTLNPETMVANLLNNKMESRADFPDMTNKSAINFVDSKGENSESLNLHRHRFLRAARSFEATRHASLESIREMKRQRSKLIKKQIFERQLSLLPDRRISIGATPSYEHRFYRTPARPSSEPVFSEYGLLLSLDANSKGSDEVSENSNSQSFKQQSFKPQSSILRGSSEASKRLYQRQDQFDQRSKFKRTLQQEMDALKFVGYPFGFYSDGGNFINAKKPTTRIDLFQTPGFKNPSFFESAENLDLFYELMLEMQRKTKDKGSSVTSSKGFLDERRKSLSPRAEGGSAAVRQRAGIDAFHEVSPRYLRVAKPRKKIAGLAHDIIGGVPSVARKNKMSYPGMLIRRTTQRGVPRGLSSGPKRYPVNLKRFMRTKSRVLMYVPYLYAKWFTQEPRLNLAPNQELLNIFINNQFDEFKYICIQSLLLLKRKIMFDIIGLKFISYKQKILYFAPLPINSQSRFLVFSLGRIERLISNFVKLLYKFQLACASRFSVSLFLNHLYAIRGFLISVFFDADYRYVRLLNNPAIMRFKHDSVVSSDMLYFDDFYYTQTAKRILAQIGFAGHSVGGWHNPLGIAGQYVPGLNFYTKGSIFFNFNYQYNDLFGKRYFAPEILMDNNLKRQTSSLFDRNFFFNEFFISPNYKRAWHFLAFRVPGPISPFIEYDRLHNFPANISSSIVKHMHRRAPLMSFRRVYDIAPNYMKGFFSTLISDPSVLVGHDITLPFKLKLLNFSLRTDPTYQRILHQFFKTNAPLLKSRILLFAQALKSKQLSVLTEFHNRVNLESLVNKRRLGFRRNVWSPFRYNSYYRFNWRTYLHRFSSSDEIGFRQYKLSPFFDLHQGKSASSLKSRALQHLSVSQIPRFELDARRRVPLNISPKEFNLLLFLYFKYVNDNFIDGGYNRLDSKIFKYVNRKIHPFLTTFLIERNPHFQLFWPQYFRRLKSKINLNEKLFEFNFKTRSSPQIKKIPNYTLSGKLKHVEKSLKETHFHNFVTWPINETVRSNKNNKKFLTLKRMYSNGMSLFNKSVKYCTHQIVGPKFLNLFRNRSLNSVLNRKLNSAQFVITNRQFTRFVEMSVRLAGFERLWLHELFFESMPFIYRFADRYILCNPKPYLNVWYKWFQPFSIRSSRFFFLIDYWSRSWGAVNQGRQSKHSLPSPAKRYLQYGFFHEWWSPKILVSRIFGIHKLFLIQRHRERLLNPQAWLNFDLFSRVRPAFRPFLTKFSKHFMFSKIIPSRGVPSYSAFIKSHTKFDNYFERHPYIAFSLGLRSTNNLINAEGIYKEVRMRSQMLDFARRHYRNAGPTNFKTTKHSFYDYSLFRKNRYVLKRKARVKRSVRVYQELNKLFPFFSRYAGQFFNSHLRSNNLTPPTGARFGDWSPAETFLDTYDLHYPLRSRRQRFHYLPLHYNYSRGFLKDANFFAVMARPRRSVKLLNILISRPESTAIKFLRMDNYPRWLSGAVLSRLFLKYGTLNPTNNDRLRSYYQPNLKIFFDFNAYKQRYNLGLLFRGLTFERDFQFFLLRKARFFDLRKGTEDLLVSNSDLDLLANFTNVSASSYFDFLIPQTSSLRGYLIESRLNGFYLILEHFIVKLNPVYILVVLVDSYLMCLFGLFSLVTFVHKFDFSIFINLFDISDNGIIYYIKKRPIFQVFFHVAVFKEYLKFSWLFSIKFLIFNIDYYPYYFLVFASLLIMRRLALNLQRQNFQSPFVVPHMWRFSDFQFNSHSGWFDRAWSEVKWEALQRLKELHAANAIEFEHEQLLSFDDIKRFKRKYRLKGRAGKFLELDEDEQESEKVDFSKFDNLDSTNPILGNPVKIFSLKGWFSRLRAVSFLPSSVDSRISDDMQLSDSRKEFAFRRARNFRRSTDVSIKSLKRGVQPEDVSGMDSTVITKKFDLREKPKLSFFWFRKQIGLLLKGRITFSKFISDFRVGPQRYSDRDILVDNYDVDDFGDEFHRLFLDPMSEFNFFTNQDLARKRIMPDDENVHFYRKPGSILQNEIMLQRFGTESDQLHYIVEFPGRFNRTYINAFSRAYAIRNLNYNQSQFGFLSFPRNAKLPTTFEEFIIFCSEGRGDSAFLVDNAIDKTMTEKPENMSLNPNLPRLRELWNLFQYVTKYEYNMLNEHSMNDTKLVRFLIEDRPVLFDNVKFWVNKAAVDAVHFNFLRPSFFSLNATVDEEELVMKGSDSEDRLVNLDFYKGREDSSMGTVSPLLSLLYMFYIYLFLFVFFLSISFLFCFIFLFLYAICNYVQFVIG